MSLVSLSVALTFSAALSGPASASEIQTPEPLDGEKLSDYMRRFGPVPEAFLMGIRWETPKAAAAAKAEHERLAEMISPADKGMGPGTASTPFAKGSMKQQFRDRMASLIRSVPNDSLGPSRAGRTNLASFDAKLLEARPELDPILSRNDRVIIPRRPNHVNVLRNDGTICQVAYVAGTPAFGYLRSCERFERYDYETFAYLIQPDGVIQRPEVSAFNERSYDPPGPGAWIWAPAKEMKWPTEFSLGLAQLLARQGVNPNFSTEPQAPQTQVAVAQDSTQASPRPLKPFNMEAPLPLTASNWGSLGVMQTPSARLPKAGHVSISVSQTKPYTHLNVMLSPFDWLEAGFRYTDISNQLYGPDIAGSQSYKDKSIDAKFRLWKESRFIPQVALGFRDLGGTGLFAGEYLVASKRFGRMDWSAGLGWGYLGSAEDASNPLGYFRDRFKNRPAPDVGEGGDVDSSRFFRGPVAFFAGVQLPTLNDRLILKLEYEGNDYSREPFGYDPKASSRFNLGAVYRITPWADLSLGFERGNKAMLGLTFHTDVSGFSVEKTGDPARIPVAAVGGTLGRTSVQTSVSTVSTMGDSPWADTAKDLAIQSGWDLAEISQHGQVLSVRIANAPAEAFHDRLNRGLRVLHRDAPTSVKEFRVSLESRGLPMTERFVDRELWAQSQLNYLPPLLSAQAIQSAITPMSPLPLSYSSEDTLWPDLPRTRRLDGGLGLGYQQTLGGPDGFLLFRLSLQAQAEWRISDQAWVYGSLQAKLIDNYDKFKYTADSNLPRVRTFAREYATASDITLPVLQANVTRKLAPNLYGVAYAGLLEPMYGGLGGEILYREENSRWAVGVDLNRVRARDFKQDFGFRDYQVNTGHATLYWDTGVSDVLAKLSLGQYLAEDRGATIDLSRQFANGVRIGAFATKTNVSAKEFGEGSFDKGIYLSIPFDAMLSKSSSSTADILWTPLTRDGGAKLRRQTELFDLTESRNPRKQSF
jgi:hypothetical protein